MTTSRSREPRSAIRRAPGRGWLAALLAAVLLAGLTVGTASAASETLVPACDGVNIRAAASTSATIKVRLGLASTVTVSGTVAGASWGTSCPAWTSGSTWYAVTHVNGEPVESAYGVAVLYAATGVLKAPAGAVTATPVAPPTPAPSAPPAGTPPPTEPPASTPPPAATAAPIATQGPTAPPAVVPSPAASSQPAIGILAPACDGVNLRTSTSTSATIKVRLSAGGNVTVAGTVGGSSWKATCPTAKSGSGWYRVTHVNGVSVASRYGMTALYAATGVLASGVAPVTPGSSPAPAATTDPVTPGSSPAPAGTAAPVAPGSSGLTTLGASVTLYGRGNGHGVGLSQYGARGRALAGQTAAQILATYYAGTTLGSIAADTRIRVLLLDNFAPTATKPLTIYGRGGPWTVTGVAGELPADARLRLFPPSAGVPSWRLLVETKEGRVLFDGPAAPDLRAAGTTPAATIQLFSKPTAYDLFRGTLRVLRFGATVDVINELPLEAYLRGVVPAEMPSTWPLEARIAQTIAARSYAAYGLHPATGTFDVFDDTRSQVYGGVRREQAAADSVISATAGQVLRRGPAIVNALFHSTAGGATENNENAFVSASGTKVASPVAYLRGSADR
ncbi:MAG TPA: SpoIID/LytB domain-containing protein, partial [Candidatus Limnocylindrales bacterium]|nr:SpoIID/LytB domain-containing protein [Candidatus Limnocylindrales bacterium]